ncbi:hypothetical protein OSSY52_13730 [Tepiditoga spiralis]|uniref:Response regulatory domain-containing protein n=1 Tax=Tepiditoga spiralis TaxID=2108365 RepID=A0A7G1GAM4_9BACT|nr:response regulator [Tepiditoga spiralis]BBE31232.1 hypothetical protein OSSY52_13730 [Tepiditoga spiralis]
MRILVVEDDFVSREIMKEIIEKNVYFAKSGKEGYDIFIKNYNKNKFDLIFLDVMMPEMNGLTLLKKIRSYETDFKTKIIMISALDDIKTIKEAKKIGCDDYIIKPIEPNEIREIIGG